jgi:hypothetical protein
MHHPPAGTGIAHPNRNTPGADTIHPDDDVPDMLPILPWSEVLRMPN